MIKQNIVFVENKAGSLKRVTGMLTDNDSRYERPGRRTG